MDTEGNNNINSGGEMDPVDLKNMTKEQRQQLYAASKEALFKDAEFRSDIFGPFQCATWHFEDIEFKDKVITFLMEDYDIRERCIEFYDDDYNVIEVMYIVEADRQNGKT